ncbi:MAG: PIG-L deacetylase family protein [Gaiellaceae bacterium]
MLKLLSDPTSVSRILCLGAHCDDIELGCGGTLLRLLEAHANLRVDWVVFSSDARRAAEAQAAAAAFLDRAAETNVAVEDFRGRFFPYIAIELKEYFDRLGAEVLPDVVFTHHGQDLHQDHRLVSELTYNTFCDHLILEYEIPKYDGDIGRPNVFVQLEASHCQRKADTIYQVFESQREKHWFSKETFLSTLRLRGIESKAPGGYAEAFYCRKLVLA